MKRINKENSIIFPTKRWLEYNNVLKLIGEGSLSEVDFLDVKFLESLGLVKIENKNIYSLTELGGFYFESLFVKNDIEIGEKIIYNQLLKYAPVNAISQYLYGIENPSVNQVITVLKYTGLWGESLTITHLLELLNHFKVIIYNRKNKTLIVSVQPNIESIPRSIFIDPKRPYSNIMWIKKIISSSKKYILWLDKHFQKEALEWIYSSADANNLKDIKILSLAIPDNGKKIKKDFARFQRELKSRGIEVAWRVIDSKKMRDNHDRWIISENEARNIPNVNAISSGQLSEINISDNRDKLESAFMEYWEHADDI